MGMTQPKIVIPIVNRTNFSKLKPIIMAIKNSLDVVPILSSGIAVPKLGSAKDDVASLINNFIVVDCLMMNDSLESMAKTIGNSIYEHAGILSRENPFAVLAVGDRFDMIAPVLAARILNIPVFHIQGGEKSGSIDDVVRDLITRCSNRHYVSTENAKKRVEKITGSSDNIFNFGCPSVEYISSLPVGDYLDIKTLHKRFKHGLTIQSKEDFLLVVMHPNTSKNDNIEMRTIIDAVLSFNMKTVIVYPNVDAFNSNIVDSIVSVKADPRIFCIKHMPVEDFVKFMAHTKCLVGNSSSGIREAASFGTPVVNIGKRQTRRDCNANIIHCECSYDTIRQSIEQSITIGKYIKNNIYFKPNCAKNIAKDIIEQSNMPSQLAATGSY